VVSPQCAKEKRFEPPLLLELLDDLQTRLNVDPNRTYLTGLSMGGSGTWATANTAPKRFAAIVPICGTAPIDQTRFLRLPTWVTVGGKDKASLVQQLQKTVAELRGKGAPTRFTLYPQLGHNCWDATYGDPKIYSWLLEHSSGKRVKGEGGR
ncbi:MAG: dienelactone hydrolase family protein, partial [Planctomycetaceae bacterium]